MKRERATVLLEELVRRAGGDGWPVQVVEAVHVFGSYSRGATEPGDLDVAVDIQRNDHWAEHFVACLSNGRDPYSELRQALRGRTRSVSILFERFHGHDDVPMILLWRRGEPLQLAVERIHAIPVDPTAGRAPRDAMLPCFDGLDKWLPRFVRQELEELIARKIITVEQIVLDDADIVDPMMLDLLDSRWTVGSPLRRAAAAALSYLEHQGVDLRSVHLHGRNINHSTTPYSVAFGLKYLSSLLFSFAERGGVQWLEVVHPSRRWPLRTLKIELRDREKLANRGTGFQSFFK